MRHPGPHAVRAERNGVDQVAVAAGRDFLFDLQRGRVDDRNLPVREMRHVKPLPGAVPGHAHGRGTNVDGVDDHPAVGVDHRHAAGAVTGSEHAAVFQRQHAGRLVAQRDVPVHR